MKFTTFDLNILNSYLEKGLLERNPHPSLPIAIWNYSRTCQYSAAWDEITLNMRATTLDEEGNLVGRAFKKFFNMEELKEIPNEKFEVFEKLDGSLITVFRFKGELVVTSKGSFTSDQAVGARKFIDEIEAERIFKEGYTYLFEYIAPENRIVVDYGNVRELRALAILINETGEEASYPELICLAVHCIPVVKRFLGIKDYKELKSIIKENEEGFIVKFESGLRMKIKGEEYVRLHRLLTNFSNVDIWELLRDGRDIDEFLDRVPDEFDAWVRKTIKDLRYHKYAVGERAGKIHDYFRYGKYGDVHPEPTKKEFAEHLEFCKVEPSIRAICFAMWDKKNYDHIIWKIIRPQYQKPFWNSEL